MKKTKQEISDEEFAGNPALQDEWRKKKEDEKLLKEVWGEE